MLVKILKLSCISAADHESRWYLLSGEESQQFLSENKKLVSVLSHKNVL